MLPFLAVVPRLCLRLYIYEEGRYTSAILWLHAKGMRQPSVLRYVDIMYVFENLLEKSSESRVGLFAFKPQVHHLVAAGGVGAIECCPKWLCANNL